MLKLRPLPTEKQIQALFEQLDPEGTGYVPWPPVDPARAKLRAVLNRTAGTPRSGETQEARSLRSEALTVFSRVDEAKRG